MNIFICIKCNVPTLNHRCHRNLHDRFWMDLITPILEEFFFWVFWTQQEKWHHCSTAVVYTCITLPVFWRSISCGRKQWKVLWNVSIKLWKWNFPLCDPVKKLSKFHDSVAVKPPVVAITDLFSVYISVILWRISLQLQSIEVCRH